MPIRGDNHVVHVDYAETLEDIIEKIYVDDDLGTQEYVVDELYDEKSVEDFEKFLALNSESKKINNT